VSKHEEFMRRAITLSRRCMIDNGSAPFAAVIVKDGAVVGEGVNNVINNCDPTSHGEVEAIRDAARQVDLGIPIRQCPADRQRRLFDQFNNLELLGCRVITSFSSPSARHCSLGVEISHTLRQAVPRRTRT
jgi:tRNA(Arg) A34 adenosine deaminase TadA